MIRYLIAHQLNMLPDWMQCISQEVELKGGVVLIYANKQVKKQLHFQFVYCSEIYIITIVHVPNLVICPLSGNTKLLTGSLSCCFYAYQFGLV
jgi:hypothetical protein